MKITHLRNKVIDYARWDEAISQSTNQLTYAFSWYLDVVSPEWEALVADNYSYIMPLPIKTRYKIPYLVQPVLTQQLGIFSKEYISEEIVKEFIKEIPYFSYELALNEKNYFTKAIESPNYVLDLNYNYDRLIENFSKNTQRNIEKSKRLNLYILENITAEVYISFYFSVDKHYLSPQQPVLEKLIKRGSEEKFIRLFGVYSLNNKLIACLCLLESGNRMIYLLPVSNEEGKKSNAMFFLINHLIMQNCNQNKTLDFEGSRIEGIARLYKGFGGKNKPYFILKRFRPSFLIGKV